MSDECSSCVDLSTVHAFYQKLITSPHNKNAYKALIAAEYVGVKIEVPPFEWRVTNKTPEFLALTPIGKVE